MEREQAQQQRLEFAGLSDPGQVRENNEDAIFWDVAAGLAVLADGMGGHNAGEVASRIAVETVAGDFIGSGAADPTVTLPAAVQHANALIYEQAERNPEQRGMGTTVVAVAVRDGMLTVAHVGDSRLYRINAGIQQLTEDHSLSQELVNAGFTAEQARAAVGNVITRALGTRPFVEADVAALPIVQGEVFLLCSDGLTDFVTDEVIAGILARPEIPLEEQARELVQAANANGGGDNISVILLRIANPGEADE